MNLLSCNEHRTINPIPRYTHAVLILLFMCAGAGYGTMVPVESISFPKDVHSSPIITLRNARSATPGFVASAQKHFTYLINAYKSKGDPIINKKLLEDGHSTVPDNRLDFPKTAQNFSSAFEWSSIDVSQCFIEFKRTADFPWSNYTAPVNIANAPRDYPNGVFARISIAAKSIDGSSSVHEFLMLDPDQANASEPYKLYSNSYIGKTTGAVSLNPEHPLVKRSIALKNSEKQRRKHSFTWGLAFILGLVLFSFGYFGFKNIK